MHWETGDEIYVFTQVFAPLDLSTTIIHAWEFYDPSLRSWVRKDSIEIPISGGRDEGYRMFSKKKYLNYGDWRVKIINEYNQTTGIKRFHVAKDKDQPTHLTTETR